MTPSSPAAPQIVLRPVREADEPLLVALFRESLGPTAAALAALPDGGATLLAQLRAGQLDSWREAFGEDGHGVVTVAGEPVGRVWTARLGDAELRLVDITLAPERRGRGLGSAVLRRVLASADAEGRTVVLHVARGNPAQQLYARLGFVVTAEDAVHLRMERAPGR